MTRSSFILSNLLILLFVASCSRTASVNPANESVPPAGPGVSSEKLVKAAVQPVEMPVNGSAEATVQVTVQNGYHINANPASYPYLIPTELTIPETEGVSVNYTYYPNPLIKKFSFAEEPLRVYEGETPIRVALQAAETAAKGQRSLAATLRIQACDDQVCYPPGSIAVAIPVLIK